MVDICEDDAFDPKKAYQNLMNRLRTSKEWTIVCIVDESCFVGLGSLPFKTTIQNGRYFCQVFAPTKHDAMQTVANHLPVIAFLEFE